jgi:hypothetical protein
LDGWASGAYAPAVLTCSSCSNQNPDAQKICGQGDEAAVARNEAIVTLRAKGNLAAVARLGA